MSDLVILDHGSVWLVWPLNIQAADWLQETAPPDAIFFRSALAVEPRYVSGVLEALDADGLTYTCPIGRYTVAIVAQYELDLVQRGGEL